MDADILCTLLAQRIPPEQFQVHGEEVVFYDKDEGVNKPAGSSHESPYDTPENRAIVADVIKNYDTLATALVPAQPGDLLDDIASWVATQANPPRSAVDRAAAITALKAEGKLTMDEKIK
jgi:hypothetical protein